MKRILYKLSAFLLVVASFVFCMTAIAATPAYAADGEGAAVMSVDETRAIIVGKDETGTLTLQDAIAAAQDGDTVRLTQGGNIIIADDFNIAYGYQYADGYTVYAVVEGVNDASKSITIDLNGQRIDCTFSDSNASSLPGGVGLLGFIVVDNKGKLVLEDNSASQTGGIYITNESLMYCMFSSFEAETTLIFNGGTYHLDKIGLDNRALIHGGNMGISTAEEGIHIAGGNFSLGVVGDKNDATGQPWIVNMNGGPNDGHPNKYLLTGGTFNCDLNHEAINNYFEMQLSSDKAFANNGDGTWTVVDALVTVNENKSPRVEVGHASFADAFNYIDIDDTVTYNFGNRITMLKQDASTSQDGLDFPETITNVTITGVSTTANINDVVFSMEFTNLTIDSNIDIPTNATINVAGDLKIKSGVTIGGAGTINVAGDVIFEDGTGTTVLGSDLTLNVTAPATVALADTATASKVDIFGTLTNNATINLDEDGICVNIFGAMTNNATINLDEDGICVNIFGAMTNNGTIDGTNVSETIRLATYFKQSGDNTAMTTGSYAGSGNLVQITYPVSVYTTDAVNFETLSIDPSAIVATAEYDGDTTVYTSLADAVANASAGATVTLLKDSTGEGLVINKNLTINFNGYTYTVNKCVGSAGTKTIGLQILKGNDVVLKNGTLAADEITPSDTEKALKMLVQNYADLTITDMTLDGTGSSAMLYVLSNNSGNVNINGDTSIIAPDGAVAFDVYDYSSAGYDAPTVNVNTTGAVTGIIEVSDTIKDNLVITQGSFSQDVDLYCEVGYHAVLKNGVYVIGQHVLTKTDATAATCTTEGNTAYWSCDACAKYFSDAQCTTEIAENSWTISATGHSYKNDCDTVCTVCRNTRTVADHYSKDTDGVCDECGEKYTLSLLEILLIVGSVIVVAGVVVAIILVKKSKKKALTKSARKNAIKPQQQKAVESVAKESNVVNENVAQAVKTQTVDKEIVSTSTPRAEEQKPGVLIVARYSKSFTAKLIQAPEKTKQYYSTLKNAILSFKKVSSRVSWSFDSINLGRTKLAKFVVRGKSLVLYMALDVDEYANSKYALQKEEGKKFKDLGAKYKITSDRKLGYALELINELKNKFQLVPAEVEQKDYALPYESIESLIEKGLIKELVSQDKYEAIMRARSLEEIDKKHRDFVSAKEVDSILSDEVAAMVVEDLRDNKKYTGKKAIINVDTLSQNFEAGDVVTVEALKTKGLVAKSVDYVKVLARGTLDKPLTVELQSYSIQAVKMIVLTGGKVEKI